jgi:hypothetical protein
LGDIRRTVNPAVERIGFMSYRMTMQLYVKEKKLARSARDFQRSNRMNFFKKGLMRYEK